MMTHSRTSRQYSRATRWLAGVLVLSASAFAGVAQAHPADAETGIAEHGHATGSADGPLLAPAYTGLGFDPPTPGSYRLPAIRKAGDGSVLLDTGEPVDLHALLDDDRYVLLSFIYTTCDDVNGCSLATFVLHNVYQQIQEQPDLAAKVRLLSLSFDPANDTPEVMHQYGQSFGQLENWNFLTTASADAINPILSAYGQSVNPVYNESGEPTGHFSHILRVFLIDPEKRIRNIYNVDFLHPEMLLADLRTLMLEDATSPMVEANKPTQSVDSRAHLNRAEQPPLGLPRLPEALVHGLTEEKVRLGEALFHDRRLSSNGTLACALCHVPSEGFAQNAMARSIGIEGRMLRRNSASLLNVGYRDRLFWDGREFDLNNLMWTKLLDEYTLGNRAANEPLSRLQKDPATVDAFARAFDGAGITMQTTADALTAYVGTLVSGESRFDRWYFADDADALTTAEIRGFELFSGRAGCTTCHTVEADHALFTDQGLHNTGLGWRHSMGQRPQRDTVQMGDQTLRINRAALSGTEERRYNDLGLYEATQLPDDRWRFRTPTLRDVALTGPYMHDGSLRTLGDVVQYYNEGGVPHALQAPELRPLGLDAAEQSDLAAFLQSLTGRNGAVPMSGGRP